jgi:hypothetical protein
MNLTSKRMLQIIAGCAGAYALTVTAQTTWVADNFEADLVNGGTTNGVVDMPIGQYKCQPWGSSLEFTNYQWFAEADDLSKLVEDSSAYGGSVRPMVGSDTLLALSLETNGKTLVRTNNAVLDFGDAAVYVDTLIKFTPSEDNPVITDESVKAAVFLDANLHLWVYHGVGSAGSAGATATDTGVVVSTNEWHRLTILLDEVADGSFDYAFKVFIDQTVVSCADGMDDNYESPGPWFYSASIQSKFSAVAFQGTGMIDELVVTDTVDLIGGGTGIMLTLAFDPAQVLVTTGGVSVAQYEQVPNDTAIAITANPWFEITDGGALLVSAETNRFNSAQITNINGTVSGSAGQTNVIVSQAFASNTSLPTGFGGAAIGDISAWAIDNNVAPEGLTEAMLDDYLLGVAPATDALLEITSIVYNGSVVTITIAAVDSNVDFTQINGILNIWTTDDLATAFAAIDRNNDFTFTPAAGSITVEVDVGMGKFIKASVDTTDQMPVE